MAFQEVGRYFPAGPSDSPVIYCRDKKLNTLCEKALALVISDYLTCYMGDSALKI